MHERIMNNYYFEGSLFINLFDVFAFRYHDEEKFVQVREELYSYFLSKQKEFEFEYGLNQPFKVILFSYITMISIQISNNKKFN